MNCNCRNVLRSIGVDTITGTSVTINVQSLTLLMAGVYNLALTDVLGSIIGTEPVYVALQSGTTTTTVPLLDSVGRTVVAGQLRNPAFLCNGGIRPNIYRLQYGVTGTGANAVNAFYVRRGLCMIPGLNTPATPPEFKYAAKYNEK